MPKSKVESVLNQDKPLRTERIKDRTYEIYGSDESFNVNPAVQFANVLVIYEGEIATGLYGLPSGEDWYEQLSNWFSDFPPQKP